MSFITPAAMQSYAREVHASVLSLQNDIARDSAIINQRAPRFIPAWRTFRESWESFYAGGVWGWSSDFETTQRFAEYLQGWRTGYEQIVGRPATGPIVTAQPTVQSEQAIDRALSIGWLLGVGLLGFLGYKILKEVSA